MRKNSAVNYDLQVFEMLKILCKYGFNIQNDSTTRYITIYCNTNACCLVYHEWPQFGDFYIAVCKSIDDYRLGNYMREYGQNWFYANVYEKYKQETGQKKFDNMHLVEFYLHNQIKAHKDIFGITINY